MNSIEGSDRTKHFCIEIIPDSILIQLQRVQFDTASGTIQKDNRRFPVPTSINFGCFREAVRGRYIQAV